MWKKSLMMVGIVGLMAVVGCRSTASRGSQVVRRPIPPPAQTNAPGARVQYGLPPATIGAPIYTNVLRPPPSLQAPATVPPVVVATPTSVAPAGNPAPAPVMAPPAPKTSEVDAAAARTPAVYELKPGDPLFINLRGIPQEQQIEEVIDEDGSITLPLINEIIAAGKSTAQLERNIKQAYIDGQYYKNVSVNVILPARSYYVTGEVRAPGRFQIFAGVTVLQAIASAGGPTEYANTSKVQITRGTRSFFVNVKEMERNPEKDELLEPGDVIKVHRSFI